MVVARFADRDMLMRYCGLGVGHVSIRPYTRGLQEDVCKAAGVTVEEDQRSVSDEMTNDSQSEESESELDSESSSSIDNGDTSDEDYSDAGDELDALGFAQY